MSTDQPTTRDRILDATLHLLTRSEPSKVRMADVAKTAGLSRQAVYLHFETRAALLIAATRQVDDRLGIDVRLAASRTAATGAGRLDAFVAAWTGYVPEIWPVARAILAMCDTDPEAAEAWDARMSDMREGCLAAVEALDRDGALTPRHGVEEATDLLWMLLSVRNWQLLVAQRGWSQEAYAAAISDTARRILLRTP